MKKGALGVCLNVIRRYVWGSWKCAKPRFSSILGNVLAPVSRTHQGITHAVANRDRKIRTSINITAKSKARNAK